MKSILSSLAICVCLVSISANGYAQSEPGAKASSADTETRARTYFEDGLKHYEAGRYLEAQASFAAGYELSHKPGFLWNMAECARLLGNDDRALELYEQYLAETDEGAPHRAGAAGHVEALKAKQPAEPALPSPDPVGAPEQTAPVGVGLTPLPPTEQGALPLPTGVGPDMAGEMPPIYERWWFWAGAAGVVATAVVTGIVIASVTNDDTAPGTPAGTFTIDWR